MRDSYRLSFTLLIVLTAALFAFTATNVHAQTPGLIYKIAVNGGNKVLDPNGDGYVSKSRLGFTGLNDETDTHSELPYRPLPAMTNELMGDLVTGSSGGHTDLAPSQTSGSTGSPIAAYFDGTNLMIRVRLGGQSTASKGYSIMIDSDGQYGNLVSGATPSKTPNPGFEYEVLLASNFEVALYDHRNKPDGGSKIWSGSVDQYFQKSIAASRANGNDDYFYDFYIPFSAFGSGITTSTKLRMSGITITSAQSGISGTVSDIGGVNFSGTYGGDARNAWKDVINSFPGISLNDLRNGGFSTTLLALPPVVNNPVKNVDTSISGTSVEPAGATVRIFKTTGTGNPVQIGTATVSSTGTWELTDIPAGTINTNDRITATVTTTGKTTSVHSLPVTAITPATLCTTTLVPTLLGTNNGNVKSLQGHSPYDGTHTIRLYQINPTTGAASLHSSYSTSASYVKGTTWDTGVALGQGLWAVTVTPPGLCESPRSNELCYNGNGKSTIFSTPQIVLTSVGYSDSKAVQMKGYFDTAPSKALQINVYVNGVRTTTSIVSSATKPTEWTVNVESLNLKEGDFVSFRAIDPNVSDGSFSCGDIASRPSNFATIRTPATAPIIAAGPYCGTTTTLRGTSLEPAGTRIDLYNSLSSTTSIGNTTVNSNGTWTMTGLNLAPGATVYYARQSNATKFGSPASNGITIESPYSGAVPAINAGTILEGSTSVSGTAPASTWVTLYINGEPYVNSTTGVVQTVQATTGGTWTFTGISPFELYPGAELRVSAKSTQTTLCESARSAPVIVQCIQPNTNFTVTPSVTAPEKVCYNNTVNIRLSSSQPGIIYNLYLVNGATHTRTGSSVLGTGQSISLTSGKLTVDPTSLQVKATKIGSVNCEPNVGAAQSVGVYPEIPNTYDISSSQTSGCPGITPSITVRNVQTGYSYQLYNLTTQALVGSAIIPSAPGDITFPAVKVNTTTDFSVYITRLSTQCSTENVNAKSIKITINGPNVVQPITQSASKVCVNSSVTFTFSSQTGVTYTLIDKATGTAVGSSVSGTGSDIVLSTGTLSSAGTKNYQIRVVGMSCDTFMATEPTVEVTTGSPNTVSAGPNATTCDKSYTLQGSDPAPGTGTWTQTSGPNTANIASPNRARTNVTGLVSGTYVFTWRVVSSCGPAFDQSSSVTITVNCDAIYSVSSNKFVDEFKNGDVLATVWDEDGGVKNANLKSGMLPRGTTLNSATGEITVTDATQLQPGNYIFTVRTVDARDRQSESPLNMTMYSRTAPPDPVTPFPVELASFSALYANQVVHLRWITASELNNDYFAIERSVDGKTFTLIGTIKGNGTTKQLTQYSFTDKQLPSGTLYYRLKQVDFSGEHCYSKIVAVNIEKTTGTSVQAYPNPFNSALNVVLATGTQDEVLIQLIDIQGAVVFKQKVVTEAGLKDITLPLSTLRKGVYILRVTGKDVNQTLKVMKTQ